jgi:hypothetical protein
MTAKTRHGNTTTRSLQTRGVALGAVPSTYGCSFRAALGIIAIMASTGLGVHASWAASPGSARSAEKQILVKSAGRLQQQVTSSCTNDIRNDNQAAWIL